LKVSKFNVDGLYIKLGKKLTLKADHITIPKSKSAPSVGRIDKGLERVKYLLTFFEYIELKKIVFDNNVLAIRFKDELLKISSKDYDISGTVKREGEVIRISIPSLYIKAYDISISGKASYDLRDDSMQSEGHFLLHDASGEFFATKVDDEISFELKSNSFSDLKSIVAKFDMLPAVRSWVVDKVRAEKYELLSLRGKGSIVNGAFDLDLDALEGQVLFMDVQIAFQDGLAPVLAPSFVLSYKNYGLYLDLNAPQYKGKDLSGSKVSIIDLDTSDTRLLLDLKMVTPFDRTVDNLLKSYDLHISVRQTKGNVNARFQADIGLKNNDHDFEVDVDFSQGTVWIDKVKLAVEKGHVHYANGAIFLNNIFLKDTLYAGKVNGQIDLEDQKVELVFDADQLALGDDEEKFFILKNQKLPLMIRYKNILKVEIPKLTFTLESNNKETVIQIDDLNKIRPYLTDTAILENGGNVIVKTKDFETYSFTGEMKRSTCFIYEDQDVCKVRVPFEGTVTPDDLDFYAFNKRFYYNQSKSRVKLENLNIDLEKFLQHKANGKGKKKTKDLILLGKNSNMRYGEYNLMLDSYDVEIKANGDIKSLGSAGGDIIKFIKKKNITTVQALRIKDNVLHPLINFNGLQNGRYSLKASGILGKDVKGEIIIEGGVMKDFIAYNNTLALINTIPSLAVLHKPGYSTEGFHIEKGYASYRMIDQKKIIFDAIHIKGGSANIAGTGEIDLENKTIDMNLAIQVAREFGEVVGSVPVLGYILMGEDKSLTVGLSIKGGLDKPVVKTTTAKDILGLPLQILQRTLQSPVKMLTPAAETSDKSQ
jgi:hypothetical protein